MNRLKIVCSILLCGVFMLASGNTWAQLKLVPIPADGAKRSKQNPTQRTKALKPMPLPFWDDFSGSKSQYPKDSLWVDSYSVSVNNGMGINQPSIFCATLDGLDSTYTPYRAEVLANGYLDKLVSRPILVTAVPVAARGQVYLSYYYQWCGNGEPPDRGDFLAVEFRNRNGSWTEMRKYEVSDTLDRTKFYFDFIQVTTDLSVGDFYHDDFQFRFRSYGRQSGKYDTWNIDYVFLNDARLPADVQNFPDRTLASQMTPLLGEYTAVPLAHFRASPLTADTYFDVANLSFGNPKKLDYLDAVGYEVRATFTNYVDGAVQTFETSLFDQASVLTNVRERKTVEANAYLDVDNTSQFEANADTVDIDIELILRSADLTELPSDTTTVPQPFIPEGLEPRLNDTLRASYSFRDYYAYDDGDAESAVELAQPRNEAVVEFETLTGEPELLAGFYIYFPPYGLSTSILTDFLIYQSDGDQPDQNPALLIGQRNVTKQEDGVFYNVGLSTDARIPVNGKFYVGWRQPATGSPKVGFDFGNDTGNRIFTKVNGSWARNEDDLHGSVMIRPYFGEGETVVGIIPEEKLVRIYPNPNKGEFFVQGKYDALTILSGTGQQIPFNEENVGKETKVTFRSTPGLYLLRITKSGRAETQKIIVAP